MSQDIFTDHTIYEISTKRLLPQGTVINYILTLMSKCSLSPCLVAANVLQRKSDNSHRNLKHSKSRQRHGHHRYRCLAKRKCSLVEHCAHASAVPSVFLKVKSQPIHSGFPKLLLPVLLPDDAEQQMWVTFCILLILVL